MDDVLPLFYFDTTTSRSRQSRTITKSFERQPKKRFCCAVCNGFITDDAQAIIIQQQHVHSRTNPQGQSFSFGCFRAAPGCRVIGAATDEHTWFIGYRWRFVHCKHCNVQMGWHFAGETEFFALILEQLVECSDNDGHE
ncbi:MAG TPA: cereblon family protein [Gammaproteobacteria bacterium]